ncbi:MAG: ABC transporter permease [Chloroflexi bacterium]|nr:ABC transporter permease [Chloroflexota bacterium]
MTTYVLRRVLQMIPVLLLVSIISFALIFMLPGDPALLMLGDQMASNREVYEAFRRELGLDRPVYVQYLDWLQKTVRGDLGTSTRDKLPVAQGIAERFPVTLELTILAMVFALCISMPAGILSAVRPNSKLDVAGTLFAIWGVAIPHFWLGILLIYALAVMAKLLPASGFVPFFDDPGRNFTLMLMPALTLGLHIAALQMRQVRSSLMEVLQQEYIITARSKGLAERAVILGHAMKNALIPVVTVIGLQIGLLFGGAVITESIFSVPGLGRWAVDSILWRDFPVVQAVCLVMATAVLFTNLAADILYAFIDPRIRYK